MALKPHGVTCRIREQIVEDEASGLAILVDCEGGRTRLVIAGEGLPHGNREIVFDEEGRAAGAGTLLGPFRRPSWLKGA